MTPLAAQEHEQLSITTQDLAEIMGLSEEEARSLAEIALSDGSAFGAGQPGQYVRLKSTCTSSCAAPANSSQCYLCCEATQPAPGVPSRSAKQNCQACCNSFAAAPRRYEACMAECDRAASADGIRG